ncbi:MAG TPA: radical SAM family heme chaperone HemW, partial [Candidatus Limnocylindria bacterium]|nr:radical SAM family heme chaperone HemW [Candidatus Limnocylindria bacterium]
RECFDVAPGAEISCEANPGTLAPAFLDALLQGGVNRLSLGAQSAHADELRLLGRIHDWAQVEASVCMARAAGIPNVNIDVMTALPGQGWDRLRSTLDAAIALAPNHLSCYSLILEEGTPLFARRDALELPDDEAERALYWNTADHLAGAGYRQYEISNFARPGFECRHNLNCWMREEYLGFGAGAAGFFHGTRRRNAPTLRGYLAGEPPETEEVAPRDAMFESVMLGLRLTQGLDLRAFEAMHGAAVEAAFPEALKQNLAAGMMERAGGRLRLTRRGLDLMDRVLLDFLP